MAREFTRNMFVMLLAIMVGTIIIIYFVGDIVNRSKIADLTAEHKIEITELKGKSENFTSHFLKSSGVLDQAREDRAFGNYHFDLGFLWYQSAISEKNNTLMDLYKIRGIANCSDAMPHYINSYHNFLESSSLFNETKSFTTNKKYIELLDLYINLTDTGSILTMLRFNASKYLTYLTENLTYNAGYLDNMTEILALFNETMFMYGGFFAEFEEIQDIIDEYEFFDEQR